MDARQIAVEDDDVVVVQPQIREGGVAAVDGVDGESGPPQPRGDQLGQDLLVLGDQYPHVVVPLLPCTRARLSAQDAPFYGTGCFADLSVPRARLSM